MEGYTDSGCNNSEVIETRIMDITVHAIDAARGLHLVAAGYSDSTIRVCTLNVSVIMILNTAIFLGLAFQ